MATAAEALAVIANYIGLTESPPGSNHCEITERFADLSGWEWAREGQPWCDMTVSVALSAVGIPTVYAYCPSHVAAFKRGDAGVWVGGREAECAAGDIVFFDWDGDGVADHVGFVEVPDSGAVTTIEGNSGGPGGDGVWRQLRPRSTILGFGRPSYSDDTPAAGHLGVPAVSTAPTDQGDNELTPEENAALSRIDTRTKEQETRTEQLRADLDALTSLVNGSIIGTLSEVRDNVRKLVK